MRNLTVHFPVRAGMLRREVDVVRAVDGVDFEIAPGQAVGLVGGSGSGKSAVGRAVLNLTEGEGRATGSVRLDGREILNMPEEAFRPLRKEMQMIFPDPYGSLNPRLRVAEIIGEAYDAHFPHFSESERLARAEALLETVGLSGEFLGRFPFEFSGGQRQRIGIARALAVEPRLIVCDEPLGALDVSAREPIACLLRDLREELGLAYLVLSRDATLVEYLSDRVMAIGQGTLAESVPAPRLPADPSHDGTRERPVSVPALP